MVIANIPDDQVFAEAAQYWNLPQLYRDLAIANAKELTSVQKKYLRGLLLGYSPQDIAAKVFSSANSVRVTLSKDVYPAIKQLCNIDPSQELQGGQVTTLLEKYRITLTLTWLKQGSEKFLSLTVEHLLELQNNLNPSNGHQLFYSEYSIIA
ncbi:MAG: hypothetical protein AUK43_16105 [Oscillatoriales cyanobacterium CG2_30_40_61]|nr:MAG: hypothetical protein AUK43_16105 [Oscillatoriales cyanobacterium CG2_30_40_61]